MTLESLYQILKKSVEAIDLENLTNIQSVYSEEYDLAVYQYLNSSENQQQWLIRLREVRNMEQTVSKLLAEHLQTLMRRALGGINFK
jgi:hypothetical protein